VDGSGLAIIIPAFNEQTGIGNVVLAARRFGTVVVVDDASTDATAAIAAEHGAAVVSLVKNAGYDGALEAGVQQAKMLGCLCFITMDADGQHNPDTIPEFVNRIREGADVVVGVRDRVQRFAESLFSVIAFWLWGIKDPLCGMKCYRMSVYEDLGHFDSYESIGTELALHAARRRRVVVNLPIRTRSRRGVSRFGNGWRANRRILRALVLGIVRFRAADSGVK